MSAFIEARKALGFAVALTCRSIGTSPSAYYQRATGVLSTRGIEDERLLVQIRRVYRANYEAYGSLRVWKALRREGIEVGRGRVERLMGQDGLVGAKRRGRAWKTTVADPAGCERPDLVNRDFSADRPDALWVADFSYVRCYEGMVFFSFVIDVFSRRIVGWQFASHMRTDLVLDALRMALTRRQHGADVDLIHHSDAGSQAELCLSAGSRRPQRPRLDRVGRRRLRQRARRELRRHLQDRADRRPHLAHPHPTRAGDRRVGRLV